MLTGVANAQFTSGNYFQITNQTLVTIDGLALTPSGGDFVLDNKTIVRELIAIPGNGGSSILRVYKLNAPITLTGELGIVYRLEELNNNSENQLKLAYASSQGAYQIKQNSTIDLAEHFVSGYFDNEVLLKVTVVEGNVALPVKLAAFCAKKVEESVLLEWSTAEEVSSDHFEIQRSPDGKSWQALGRVNAQGESNSQQYYSFTDYRPAVGTNLYRLKMVDTDGASAFSKLVTIRFDGEGIVSVYPNPVSQLLHIRTPGNEVLDSVDISSLAGRVVCRSSEPAIKLGVLPAGTYIVEVKMKSGLTSTVKVIHN